MSNDTLAESESFKFKFKFAGTTNAESSKYEELVVPLNYLSNCWKNLKMPSVNYQINLILTWSKNFAISISPDQQHLFQ